MTLVKFTKVCVLFLQGCLFFCEACHFCTQLSKGNVRSVEALCAPPESVIFCLPDWLSLAAQVNTVALLGKTFVDLCLGQAMGVVAKKRTSSGKFAVREDATLTKFCDSFRRANFKSAKKNLRYSSF